MLLAITAVCFVLTEKQNKINPSRISTKVVDITTEKDLLSQSTISETNLITKDDSNPSSVKKVKILNKDIQEMVDLIVFLNGIQNPNLIKPNQLLLCRFPDNRHFEFYEEVGTGQCLWSMVKNLLEVTNVYRPTYKSH